MTARLAVLATLLAAAAGCGGDEDAPDASTPAPASTSAAGGEDPGAEPTGENAFVGSLAADPSGGTLLLATGVGLFRAESGARTARRVVGRLQAPPRRRPGLQQPRRPTRGPRELLASGSGGRSGATWKAYLKLS